MILSTELLNRVTIFFSFVLLLSGLHYKCLVVQILPRKNLMNFEMKHVTFNKYVYMCILGIFAVHDLG